MSDKLTIHDLRAAGFCVSGIKTHYDRLGLDVSFRDFVRHGYPLEKARLVEDAHAKRAVEKADERIAAAKEAE
jgi:hypothetical protein